MSSVNKAILLGYLGADPETRYTGDGAAITSFRIATSERWKDKTSGEQQEKTEWHRCVTFGKVAEIAGEYLKKGSLCYVEGRLQTRKWQDKEGQDRYTTEITVGELKFFRSPGEEAPAQTAKPVAEKPAAKPAPTQRPVGKYLDDLADDIPF